MVICSPAAAGVADLVGLGLVARSRLMLVCVSPFEVILLVFEGVYLGFSSTETVSAGSFL